LSSPLTREALELEVRKRGLAGKAPLPLDVISREIARRGLVPYDSFKTFVEVMDPTLLKFEHIPKLIDVAERMLQGTLRHVMVLAPPRYLKSQVFSRLLPAYYLLKYQTRTFALASYAATLAFELSEAARENFVGAGGTLSQETSAKARWQTTGQGTMWAVGVHGGGALGRGFHMGAIDDPMHPDHAYSYTRREQFKRWYENTWLRALEPQAQLAFIMQRLHVEDPIDYLFRREMGEGEVRGPMHWHVVVLDEVKSDEPLGRWSGPQGLPPTCTLEPDERKVGQVLAPSRFSPEEVKERQGMNPLVTSAQRQQRPLRPSGDFWREGWFRTYDDLPAHAYNGGWDWDTAQTANERNSATAGVQTFRGPSVKDHPNQFDIYVHDLGVKHVEFPEMIAWMNTCGGPHYVEDKSSGKSSVQALKAQGVVAKEVPVKGDKLARASAVQPTVSAGRVYVRSAIMPELLYMQEQGLLRITAEGLQGDGEGLDLNDAFVQGLTRHLGINQPTKPKLVYGGQKRG